MKYYLSKNPLNKNKDNYIGRIPKVGILNKDDLINEMAKEGTGITIYEVESIFKRLENVLADLLSKGYAINTPIVNFKPSMRGVFNDWDDTFDRKRHNLQFKTSSGVILKKKAKMTKLYKSEVQNYSINIFSFTNHQNKLESHIISPNGIGELRGRHLKLDTTNLRQGIFLIANDKTEYRVDTYAHNTPSKQLFQIPNQLKAGEYILELRSIPLHSSQLKKGRLTTTLLVL